MFANRRRNWWFGGGILLLLVILVWARGRNQDQSSAADGNHEAPFALRLTGKLVPADSVDLGFSRGGIVAFAGKDVGEVVVRGALLTELNLAELRASLLEAEASAEAELAKLEELKLGTRSEELLVSQNKVSQAETSLSNAEATLHETLLEVYTEADDAVRHKADQLFDDPDGGNPDLKFSLLDQNSYVDPDFNSVDGILVEVKRRGIEKMFVVWAEQLGVILPAKVASNLDQIKVFLNDLAAITNRLVPVINLEQDTIDDYKTVVSAARDEINTAIADLLAARNSVSKAEAELVLAKSELSLDEAGTLPQVVMAQDAKVKQASAKVASIRAQITGGQIVAPFAGTISRYEVETGEAVNAGTALVSLISTNNLEIEANVPESYLGRVNVGDAVAVEFDAFLGEKFSGRIVSIDPAETLVDGVVNFRIKIALDNLDARLRSGLTANLEILP